MGHYSNSPFKKWNKDRIVDIIRNNGFSFSNEHGGIFFFHRKNANNIDSDYMLYLRRTMLFICNPNRISPAIKSHKQLDYFLKKFRG